MEALISALKNEIIKELNLDHIKPEEIDIDAPLFQSLGLDSIDALTLIVIIEKRSGQRIKTAEEGKTVLRSLRSMAEFIASHKK